MRARVWTEEGGYDDERTRVREKRERDEGLMDNAGSANNPGHQGRQQWIISLLSTARQQHVTGAVAVEG